MLGKLLLVNSLFLIFSNAQLSIILAFVNKQYKKNEILTNSIGTVNTIMNILIYPLILGVTSSLEILGSQSFGAKKYSLFSFFLSNLRYIGNCFIFLICFLIYLFHQNIFKAWKIDAEVQNEALKLIFIRFISLPFEFEIYFKLRYLQIINKSAEALFIITVNGFLLPLFGYTFIIFLNMYSYGCGFVYLSNNIFMLISILTYIYLQDISEKSLIHFLHYKKVNDISINNNIMSDTEEYKNNKNNLHERYATLDITEDNIGKNNLYESNKYYNNNKTKDEESFIALFGYIVPLYLISLMDNLSVESMSIFANYFEAKEYSEFLNAYSLYALVGTISVSFNTSSSIIISANYGVCCGNKMKKLFYQILGTGLIIAIILGSLLFTFSENILKILLQSAEIGVNIKYMFYLSIVCNMIDIIQYILLSALKSFGFIYLGFSVYFVGNIINFLIIYFFSFNTNMKIIGIFFGYFITEIITISLYFFVFFFFVDFQKVENDYKNN